MKRETIEIISQIPHEYSLETRVGGVIYRSPDLRNEIYIQYHLSKVEEGVRSVTYYRDGMLHRPHAEGPAFFCTFSDVTIYEYAEEGMRHRPFRAGPAYILKANDIEKYRLYYHKGKQLIFPHLIDSIAETREKVVKTLKDLINKEMERIAK